MELGRLTKGPSVTLLFYSVCWKHETCRQLCREHPGMSAFFCWGKWLFLNGIGAACLGYSQWDDPVLLSTPWQQQLEKEWTLARAPWAGSKRIRKKIPLRFVFSQEQVVSARVLHLHSHKFCILTTSVLNLSQQACSAPRWSGKQHIVNF